ncbi:MAG: hypothetical protein Kow0079_14470 [Vicingaceae bacterium]
MKKIALYSLVLTIGFFSACKKAKLNKQTTTTADNSTAENLFNDVKRVVEEAANDEGQSAKLAGSTGYTFGSCATVTVSPAWNDTIWPKTMTIDFGSTNCTGYYGVKRRGKLVVTMTDRYRNAGSKLTVTPVNYYVNDYKVEGTKTLTNNGRNSAGNLTYTVNVTNAKVTSPDGDVVTWNSTRTNEWIAGESTTLFTNGFSGICDDVYLITGSANGVNREGRSFTVTITEPLRKEICCRWIVSGKLEIQPQDLKKREVDFGNGACDAQVEVKIGKRTYNIVMN